MQSNVECFFSSDLMSDKCLCPCVFRVGDADPFFNATKRDRPKEGYQRLVRLNEHDLYFVGTTAWFPESIKWCKVAIPWKTVLKILVENSLLFRHFIGIVRRCFSLGFFSIPILSLSGVDEFIVYVSADIVLFIDTIRLLVILHWKKGEKKNELCLYIAVKI